MPRTNAPKDPEKMTPAELADALGSIKAEVAPLTEREKALKDEFKSRGITEAIGELYEAVRVESDQERIDASRLAAKAKEMGVQIGRYINKISVVTVRVVARKRTA